MDRVCIYIYIHTHLQNTLGSGVVEDQMHEEMQNGIEHVCHTSCLEGSRNGSVGS